MATNHSAIGAQRGTLLDYCFVIDTMNGKMGARCSDVGEYTTGATKDIILNFDSLINRYIILDAHTIANVDIIPYIDILTKRATGANTCSALNVTEMPYLSILANDYIIIDITAFMNKRLAHSELYF